MLSSLGNALKKTFDKISGSIFLDKKTIDSIVKELQRGLIEADVNVALVAEISKKIREEASEEKIKGRGIDRKEHLVKLLHDEILQMLGGEKKELELKKKTKIMMLGLYGSGKCVHGSSKVQLSNGNISQIRDIYNNYREKLKEESLEDGKIIDISDENLTVPSFNPSTCKIENKKATHIWKLNKKELIEMKIDNGNDFSIRVTPEHPFFVLRNGEVSKVRADEVTESDYIAIPREIEVSGRVINLSDKIKNLNLFVYLAPEETRKIISQRGKTIKEIAESLKNKLNYCQLTSELKEGKTPIELVNLENFNSLNTKAYGTRDIISVPLFLTSEFAEFLGYLMGDGHIDKRYVEIVSEDQEVISRLIELSKLLFNLAPKAKRDIRTKKMYKIIIASKTLVEILKIFNLNPGKKGKELKIPEEVLSSNEEVVRSFIKAYFDCDSSPNKQNRAIELCSESKVLIQQMRMLLTRFGIMSTISKRVIKNIPYWRLYIKARYAEKYAEKIGYLIKHKRDRAKEYNKIGALEGCGNQDMIPLGKALKEFRIKNGFSIGEIQTNAVYSYGRYEEKGLISREKLLKLAAYYKLKKKGIFLSLLEDIFNNTPLKNKYSNAFINGILPCLKNSNLICHKENKILISNEGKCYLESIKSCKLDTLLTNFENFANSQVCWIPVIETKSVLNDENFVYDLTVEDNHSFIAEGFIVHNTTTSGKLALYYSKRGKNPCLVGLDVHRPAAADQLEQLAGKIKMPVFIDKQEKDPLKIYKDYKKEIDKHDLVIIDTAGRHSLDRELVEEIKKLKEEINPDYVLLVIPADIGQAAKKQASEFQKACAINGVVITRMDSSARGGGALTACNETSAPVFFIGTGEKMADIETFNPASFISRILGLGDLESLVEKVKTSMEFDEKKQKKLQKKLQEGKLDLRDLQTQLKSMQGMGSLSKIAEMIPGLGKAKIPEGMLGAQEDKLKKWQHAIDSMTRQEIENPEILEKETSRLKRIAAGSGTSTTDIRQLIKQYKLLKEFASGNISDIDPSQGLSQKQMMKLAKKFGKKMRLK